MIVYEEYFFHAKFKYRDFLHRKKNANGIEREIRGREKDREYFQVSQFHSDLSLFDSRGREVSRKVMSVNDPLRYGGFTMYQTDWGISTIQVRVDGEGPFNLVAAALQTGDSKLFGTFLPIGDTNSNEPPKGM